MGSGVGFVIVWVHVAALFSLLRCSNGATPSSKLVPFNRTSFPPGFIFGSGSASYQSEGAAFEGGKGKSIWDTFVRAHPEKILDRSTGDVADDFYHRYKIDEKDWFGFLQIFHLLEQNTAKYQMDLPDPWNHNRVMTWHATSLVSDVACHVGQLTVRDGRRQLQGRISGGINQRGVKFYNDLINELLANGLKPFVTLIHFDTPQALEDEYGSFLSHRIVGDFVEYAEFCFKTYGDRVKNWATMNEPNGFAANGYSSGSFAPGRCSNYAGNCTAGNSATEPYIAAHNMLLSHSAAVKTYRDKFQGIQKGQIGITIVTNWYTPKFNTPAARAAAAKALDFFFGWFAHSVTFGDYPESMKAFVGDRLPKFTKEESELLKGSLDYLGLNYYTTNYAETVLSANHHVNQSFSNDGRYQLTTSKNGKPIGTPTALPWLFIYPKGLEELLVHIKQNYNNPPIYITENGMADDNKLSLPVTLKDSLRIKYHSQHLSSLLRAIKGGVNVKGYYIWSFFDDFEWDAGYTVRFGIAYVDFKNNLKRHLKYYWFKLFLAK